MALSYIFTIRLHPEAAFVLMSVAASFDSVFAQAQPGSGSYSSSSLFSPERILCSAQPCFGSQCDWEAVEKNERALGAGEQAGEGLLKEGATTVLEGQRGTAQRDREIARAHKRG